MGRRGTVLSIHRYPLKGAGGQQLRSIEAQTGGLALDRAWACIDDDGMVGSLKQPALWHGLTSVRVEGPEDGDGPVEVFLDDWSGEIEAEVTRGRLSAHLGRGVRVSCTPPETSRLRRRLNHDASGFDPSWLSSATSPLGEPPPGEAVTEVAGTQLTGRFMDLAPIHVVTTGALRSFSGHLYRDVPARRFRPNLVLDLPSDPPPGAVLHLGDVALHVISPTPRCVVPAVTADRHALDRDVLATLARHHRQPVLDLGTASCFGVYATVLTPGVISVGTPVT